MRLRRWASARNASLRFSAASLMPARWRCWRYGVTCSIRSCWSGVGLAGLAVEDREGSQNPPVSRMRSASTNTLACHASESGRIEHHRMTASVSTYVPQSPAFRKRGTRRARVRGQGQAVRRREGRGRLGAAPNRSFGPLQASRNAAVTIRHGGLDEPAQSREHVGQ